MSAVEPVTTDAAAATPGRRSGGISRVLVEYAICLVLVAVVVIATALDGGFIQGENLKAVLVQSAPVGIVAAGMTLVVIAGGFDLSVGAIFAGGAVLFPALSNKQPLLIASGLVLLAGAAAGAVNGLLVTRVRVNPFVATLGTGSVYGGVVYLGSNSTPVTATKASFSALGNNTILGVPASWCSPSYWWWAAWFSPARSTGDRSTRSAATTRLRVWRVCASTSCAGQRTWSRASARRSAA
jgi:ribose/xylose/arabinose/galactoside ABC-type transport system permease subunit